MYEADFKQIIQINRVMNSSALYKNTIITDLEGEQWKDLLGYEGLYMVSNLGRIKSLLSNRILKQWFGGNKQLLVTLCADGIKSKVYVSNIVGACFVGVCDRRKNEVYTHLNMVKTDNRACNIGIESKSSERLLAYHYGRMHDWGIKNAGAGTRFAPLYFYIGTKMDGTEVKYTSEELIEHFGSGARSIFRCIAGEKSFNTAYKMKWRKELIKQLTNGNELERKEE